MGWTYVRVVGNTLANLDGRVRSLNPSHNEPVDGTYGPYHWEDRDPGASGGYEQTAVNGLTVAYNPTGKEEVIFWFFENIPHTDGLSLLSTDPIDPAELKTIPLANWKGL